MTPAAFPVTRLALLLLPVAACCAPAPDHPPTFGSATAQQDLQAAGRKLPLTLHPIRVLERPMPRAAMALGLVLEKYGMDDLEVAPAPFDAGNTPWAEVPARFGQFVKDGGSGRDHLYAEFLGTPETGPTAVRFVIVDKAGKTVLIDEQKPGDADFERTAAKDPDPLGCATLVAERLFRIAQWKIERTAAVEGRFQKLWRDLSGSPDAARVQAMRQRRDRLARSLTDARIAVLPTRVNAGFDAKSSARIAEQLGKLLPSKLSAPADGAHIAIAPESNEQKVLWDLARGLGAAVRDHAPDADYALVVDIGMAGERSVGFVHLALCDRQGEPVIVDFANDQNVALRQAAPTTLAEAEQFAANWLADLLR